MLPERFSVSATRWFSRSRAITCGSVICSRSLNAEPDRVHVLGVHLHRRAEERQLVAERLEEVLGVARVVRAEERVVVLADLGRRHEACRPG